jgi:hypothetical protein
MFVGDCHRRTRTRSGLTSLFYYFAQVTLLSETAAVEEIEQIVSDASRSGIFEKSKETIVQEYLNDLERRVRRLYDGMLAITSQRFDREDIAKLWESSGNRSKRSSLSPLEWRGDCEAFRPIWT